MVELTAPPQGRLISRECIIEEQKLNLLWSPHAVHFFLVLCTPKEHQNPPIYIRSMKISTIGIFSFNHKPYTTIPQNPTNYHSHFDQKNPEVCLLNILTQN